VERNVADLLATAPQVVVYVNLIKVGVVAALTIAWGLAAQWVDIDTDVVKTKRKLWNMITIGGGLVAFFVLFIIPWTGTLFGVGLAAWFVIAGSGLVMYVIHRNGRVIPEARVMTVSHLKRTMARNPENKKDSVARSMRVRISDHKGNFVASPSDPKELQAFKLVQDFLYNLLWRRASIVDLSPAKDSYRVRYKIDGVATEDRDGLSTTDGEAILTYLKSKAGLNVEEIRRPQKGRIQTALLSHAGDVGYTEVHTSGTTAGERMRLNICTSPTLLRLNELGLAAPRLEKIQKDVLAQNTGLLVISSTPHNGVSTTCYAILRNHDAYMNNIHSLERSSITELDNITQHCYEGSNTDVNYARMLQTILRRDPDIVMVGDCDDAETAQIAVRAAAQDRKIYLNMNAENTFDALSKLVDYVDDNALLAKGLTGILSQRLIRVLCNDCREAFRPDEKTLKKLNLPANKIERFYRPPTEKKLDRKGREIVCETCQGTGYVGRTGVYELLVVDDAIRSLIAEGASISKIKALARKSKMYYLMEEALLKVIDGTTSLNEVIRSTKTSEK